MQRSEVEHRTSGNQPVIVSDPTQNAYGNNAAAGNLPKTETLADALHTTEVALHDTSVRPPPELNAQGRRLLTDLENMTSSERRFLEEKNPDNLIQQIMIEGRLAAQEMQKEFKTGSLQGVDKATQRQMADQANTVLSDVQALAMEVISSQNFRTDLLSLFECFALIAQEITGVEVTKLTEPLRDAPDALKDAKDQGGRKQVMETAKEKAKEVAQGAKEMANDVGQGNVKQLDHEQFERLVDKLRQTFQAIGSRPKTKRVMGGMFSTFNMFTSNYAMSQNKEQVADKAARLNENVHINNLQRHVRTLVERFAGQQAVATLINHVSYIVDTSAHDHELRDYFIEVRDFVKSALDNPDYFVEGGSGEKELRSLIKRGRKIFEKKELREHFLGTINGSIEVIQNFVNDPHLAQMQADISQFISDLVTDDAGNIVITKNALNQLKVILVSSLLERMAIPIPMISHEDEKMEFEISNLWLVLKDVIPDMVHLEYREALDFDTSDLRGKGVGVNEDNQIIIHAMNMKYSMKDANIWWKRKKFPKSEDSGMLDMNMPGEGIELRIVLSLRLKDKNGQVFVVKSVDCDIDKINLKLSGTKHDKIYNTFLGLSKGAMKKRVETAIEEKVTDIIGMLNGQVSRAVVNATIGSKNKLVSGITSKVESLTGVALAPGASAEKERKSQESSSHSHHHETASSTYTTTSTTTTSAAPVERVVVGDERVVERDVTYREQGSSTVLKEGDAGYIKETVRITTPDGQTTTTKREVPYS